jgi:hypothetical protein
MVKSRKTSPSTSYDLRVTASPLKRFPTLAFSIGSNPYSYYVDISTSLYWKNDQTMYANLVLTLPLHTSMLLSIFSRQ